MNVLELGHSARYRHGVPVLKNPTCVQNQWIFLRVRIQWFFLRVEPDCRPPLRFSIKVKATSSFRHGVLARNVTPLRAGMSLRWTWPENPALLLQAFICNSFEVVGGMGRDLAPFIPHVPWGPC